MNVRGSRTALEAFNLSNHRDLGSIAGGTSADRATPVSWATRAQALQSILQTAFCTACSQCSVPPVSTNTGQRQPTQT